MNNPHWDESPNRTVELIGVTAMLITAMAIAVVFTHQIILTAMDVIL